MTQPDNAELYKRYGVTRLSATVERDEPPVWETVSRGNTSMTFGTEEKGRPNVRYVDGKPTGRDRTADFGYHARGIKGDPGVFWQTYLADPLVKSSVDGAHEGLTSGDWNFEVPKDTPKGIVETVESQAAFCQETLLDRPAAWSDFLKGWTYGDRVYGFSLWEVVDSADGGIEKLAYRRPGTVDKWLFSEDGRDWAGTRFDYVGDAMPVDIPAEDLLLYSTGIGLDLEGISALRPVVRWVEIKQLITQIETAAAESHGNGYKTIRSDKEHADEGDLDKIKSMLAAAAASDDPVFAMPGYFLEWISPAGKLPDFDALRRYCDEQISLALKSTGSLVGLGDNGTYAHMEVKDNIENVRRIRYFGNAVCNLINEHIVPRILRNRFRAPLGPWRPRLVFNLGTDTRDPEWLKNIIEAAKVGLIDPRDPDVQAKTREYLDLAPVADTPDDSEPDEEPADDAPDDEDEGEGDETEMSACRRVQDETEAEKAIRLGEYVPMALPLELAQYDPKKLNKWIDESNDALGRALRKVATQHRDEYVRLTAGVSDPAHIANISRRMRDLWLPKYEQAVKGELNRLIVKGSASQLRELGVLAQKQGELALPSVPKNVDKAVKRYQLKPLSGQFHRHIELQAQRVAKHSYNVSESYLEKQAVRELGPDVTERLKPDIPSATAFAKTANAYTARSFQYGREQIVQRIQNEARSRGIEDTRVIAEYSSVMETGVSCQPCMGADGTRCFVGSSTYQTISPPNRCEGGDKCRCMWSVILPSERGYEQIIDDLNSGGSKVTSGLGLSQLSAFGGDGLIASILTLLNGADDA